MNHLQRMLYEENAPTLGRQARNVHSRKSVLSVPEHVHARDVLFRAQQSMTNQWMARSQSSSMLALSSTIVVQPAISRTRAALPERLEAPDPLCHSQPTVKLAPPRPSTAGAARTDPPQRNPGLRSLLVLGQEVDLECARIPTNARERISYARARLAGKRRPATAKTRRTSAAEGTLQVRFSESRRSSVDSQSAASQGLRQAYCRAGMCDH